MGALTIRNLDEDVKHRLRVRAAEHGVSMEEEARRILGDALGSGAQRDVKLGSALHALFQEAGAVELELPPREPMRSPPDFD